MRYQNDCCKCVPLGEYLTYDLYCCPQNGWPTVIARYEDEPSGYTSCPIGVSSELMPIREAKIRALDEGLFELIPQEKEGKG